MRRTRRVRGPTLFGQVAFAGINGGGGSYKSLIGKRGGLDFNITTDQAIGIGTTNITAGYRITQIIVQNASINMTTAVGGIYTAASIAVPPFDAAV